ncbi:hypothetical protein KGQ19_04145 [Catenulispora sp. NL8]|uniref:Uncharacterized protein n=1 Tax=Catenulispora pinistramenti TaxID=2705254 RepID=A0ABS5KIY1_9ACTN|nr:hypothetical protein [Catenulispora pinistramenti]MBS2546052.1 hypothetical protein [Catenulispora pinistramenti]
MNPSSLIVPLNIPARDEADPRSGISFGSGYQPDRLHADLDAEFKRRSTEPVPSAEPVTVVLDGVEYEGLQLSAGGLRVAAAGVGTRLLVVSVVGWDGPLILETVAPRSTDAE